LPQYLSLVSEDQLVELSSCSDLEKKAVETDLRKRKKQAHFEALGPNLWNLTSRGHQTKKQDGEELVDTYVWLRRGMTRIQHSTSVLHFLLVFSHFTILHSPLLVSHFSQGGFEGKLARVASCKDNGTTCSVSLVQMSDSEKRKHTTISLYNLEVVDMATLSELEVARINIDKERRKKKKENSLTRSVSGPMSPMKKKFSLGRKESGAGSGSALKKRARENDGSESDDSETTEAADGDEARNQLYWSHSINLPVLWFGDSSKLPDDPVRVLAITTVITEPSEGSESVAIGPSATSSSTSTRALPLSSRPSPDITSSLSSSSSSFTSTTSPSNYRTVLRKSLVLLDDDVLKQLCSDPMSSALCGALLDFADWDYERQDSYQWPRFIINIIRSVHTIGMDCLQQSMALFITSILQLTLSLLQYCELCRVCTNHHDQSCFIVIICSRLTMMLQDPKLDNTLLFF
jgi:hypothetical protein